MKCCKTTFKLLFSNLNKSGQTVWYKDSTKLVGHCSIVARDPGSKPGGGWPIYFCLCVFICSVKRIIINKRAPTGATFKKRTPQNCVWESACTTVTVRVQGPHNFFLKWNVKSIVKGASPKNLYLKVDATASVQVDESMYLRGIAKLAVQSQC